MKVQFKKLVEEAVLPYYGSEGAAGLDMTATSKFYDEYGNIIYGTGIAGKIPDGYVALLFPRSSNAKKDLILSNCVGVWDSDYIGEIFFKFKPIPKFSKQENWGEHLIYHKEEFADVYQVGDRIGQLLILPYPQIEPEWAVELPKTTRGNKGWGSTGA